MAGKFISFIKKDWPILLIALIPLILAVYFYPQMPEKVPSHWNYQGEIDGYMSSFGGTFFLPLMNIGMYVLFLVLPMIDPKKANYSNFAGAYKLIRYIIHLFFAYVFGITLAAALGYEANVSRLIPYGMAFMLIGLGYAMRKIRHNYFVGFRMPWTLANEKVWDKTHRFGSTAMMIGGAIYLLGNLVPALAENFILFMVAIIGPILLTLVYSYWAFQQETK